MSDFLKWPVVGSGNERVCYRDPEQPSRCVKVSHLKQSKQTRREIKYYQYLVKRRVSFAHIPKFFRKVEQGQYIGMEMEFICNEDGSRCASLREYLNRPLNAAEVERLESSLTQFKHYLIDNNIIPCDFSLSNLIVMELGQEQLKIMMIDGLGSTELIPLSIYIRSIGRRKIERKWQRFISQRVEPLIDRSQ
ncbi:YrbL family protein [Vibrio sp. WXL103]|uniref:YrbL family protein n=1 Tax=Vibrio sp. WXL103 TaxID=3450710 RepID=UPI003EC55EE6